jgi:predicted nucleotidyltransferase
VADIGNTASIEINAVTLRNTIEQSGTIQGVVEVDQIIALSEQLAAACKPLKVVLFGSYAYGTPTEDSDVDVMVLTRSRKSNHQQFIEVRRLIDVEFAMDLVVRRETDVLKRIQWNDFFLREVMEKGIVLHAADDAGMGRKGRRRLRCRLAVAAIA